MVVVGQSVTLPVPGLAEESNSDTESHGEEEGAAESALYIHQILILIQVTQREGKLIF